MTSEMQHNDILEEDLVAIMGMTGSGKSTFLNLIIGENRFKVGHDLKSETTGIQEFRLPYEDEAGRKRLLCLLDTPGFGDTYKLDSETLGIISSGLLERPKITGIIYLHNINEPRLTHLAYQATEIFYDLCGGDAMKNVILCTSQWDSLMDKTKGEARESQLLDEYWTKMINDGARTARHDNSLKSAGGILKLILGNNPVTPKLVAELQMPGVTLGDTSAGKAVSNFNTEKAKEIEHDIEELEKSLVTTKMENEELEVKRAEDEKMWLQRESEILAQLKEAEEAVAAAKNALEVLQADQAKQDAEAILDSERTKWVAQQKAYDQREARGKAKALRIQQEWTRLKDKYVETETETKNLEKPFDPVEYANSITREIMGDKLGGLVGGLWGYTAKAGFMVSDAAAGLTGGKKFSERAQEAMKLTGESAAQGYRDYGFLGATAGLARGGVKNIFRASDDIFDQN